MPLLRSRAFFRRANSYFFSGTIAAFAGSREVESIAQIIDGKAIANSIRAEIKTNVKTLNEMYGRAPGLAVVLVGARKDSQTYVRMKKRACEAAGIASFEKFFPDHVSEAEVVNYVRTLNESDDVHGILVQLPLPDHINEQTVLREISVNKDVDGFHPINIGRLAMKNRTPTFVPCTPKGCIELLVRSGVEIQGARAVVLGRSNIVGIPVAMLLMEKNATVTICHSHSRDIAERVREADILVACCGVTNMVKGDWIKPGAVVIDVGINSVPDDTRKAGYRLVGDVDFEEAKNVAGMISPVPGGVGPMTIAMLLQNCVDSAARAFSKANEAAAAAHGTGGEDGRGEFVELRSIGTDGEGGNEDRAYLHKSSSAICGSATEHR